MRIGLIGDVHTEHERLESTLATLSALAVDAILCTGDIADGPGDINRCIGLLQQNGVPCVCGNHDEWLLHGAWRESPDATPPETVSAASRTYLEALPFTLEMATPEGPLLLCHGMGTNNMAKVNEDDFDFSYTVENSLELQDILRRAHHRFVVFGHTHRHWLRTYGGITFVNAGTLLRYRHPGYAVLDTAMRTLDWIPAPDAHEQA